VRALDRPVKALLKYLSTLAFGTFNQNSYI
jgi:hypothetical protein